jgi:HKD family nuclease
MVKNFYWLRHLPLKTYPYISEAIRTELKISMHKAVLLTFFLVLFFQVNSQGQLSCDLRGVDSLMTPSEKGILECLKTYEFEKYLGKKDINFYDSLITCANKSVRYIFELKGNFSCVGFFFTEDFYIKFYIDTLKYTRVKTPMKELDIELVNREIPARMVVLYSLTLICEAGKMIE